MIRFKVHSFKNVSNQLARLLCTVVPAGLDEFFQDVAAFMETAITKCNSFGTINERDTESPFTKIRSKNMSKDLFNNEER